jgi:pre-mycofactocin synthase
MADHWFESVAEAQRRAQKRLPKSVYGALIAGSERGVTLDDNVAAFGELGFAPHVAHHFATREQATTVLSQPVSLPLIISPTGVQAVHPDGEVAVARAAAARGTAMGLSSFASKPVEEVVAANPQTFFQLYWSGTREHIRQRMERAKAAGAVGLILTLDWSFSNGRDWGSPVIPERIDLKTMMRFAPEAATRLRWLSRYARTGTSSISACQTWRYRGSPPRRSSQPTASGCRPCRRNGTTSTGCAASGTAHCCSRGSRTLGA